MTGQVHIRFYKELNDFLPPGRREREFAQAFKLPGSVKDLIESLGVPHTEIDLILVNKNSVDFSYLIHNDDRISVYPAFATPDITPLLHLQPVLPDDPGFVLDTHLGRLAAHLRMLGFDTLYRNDYDDPTLVDISTNEQRMLLTCDRQLLMRSRLTLGYFVRNRQPKKQLIEILQRFGLFGRLRPFSRCMHCNGDIHQIDKKDVASTLMPRTSAYYEEFWQCERCRKVYWKGSHYRRMLQLLNQLDPNVAVEGQLN